MKTGWKIQRELVQRIEGQRRWDQAYQCLLRWEKEMKSNPFPNPQEASHASSPLCSGIDPTTSSNPEY
jgi:hypothetical protein